jgi:hypothetical protein
VRIVNGQRVASSWSVATATTQPVQSPRNLVIEIERTDYNRQTEVMISFDAPIADLGELGTQYSLQYQLREDGSDWSEPVTMDANTLKTMVSDVEGDEHYKHFIYKITGLKPSTGYSIRVRMIDESGDMSLYTSPVNFRTDMDQDEYDESHYTDDWMGFIKEEIERLVKDPYWATRDYPTEFEVVYRSRMYDGLRAQAAGGQIRLAETNAMTAVYYIPATFLNNANSAGLGFTIPNGDMEIILSPGAVNTTYNEALLGVLHSIEVDQLEDYFIRLRVARSDYYGQIEGNDPLSQQAEVVIEAVGTSGNIDYWDNTNFEELALEVAKIIEADGMADRIKNMLSNNVTNEDIALYVYNIVSSVRNAFGARIASKLYNTLRGSAVVARLDAPMIIYAKNLSDETVATGYKLTQGTWLMREAVPYGSGKAMYADEPGVYIFAGRTVVIPGIQNMAGAGTITAIVAKYGLDDFFGKGESFNLEANASRSAVISSVARMAGAPRGSDAQGWLRTNGITLPTRDMYGDIQTQEAVFLVMELYEARTGTNLSTLTIRNHALTAGITGLNDNYKASVKAAFELGLYGNQAMEPAAGITSGEILEMLYTLDGMIKL